MRTLLSTATLAMVVASAGLADAGCNCSRGGSATVAGPVMAMPAPAMAAPMMAAPMMRAPVMPYGAAAGCGPVARPMVGVPARRPMAPPVSTPPGTLGRTYELCSRPLPEDDHPRSAGLEIEIADAQDIFVEKMEGFRDENGLWYFTLDKPWIPTRPAIVKVVISRVSGGSVVRDVRVVRLIPGRILTVRF